jgi:hypothetical protein
MSLSGIFKLSGINQTSTSRRIFWISLPLYSSTKRVLLLPFFSKNKERKAHLIRQVLFYYLRVSCFERLQVTSGSVSLQSPIVHPFRYNDNCVTPDLTFCPQSVRASYISHNTERLLHQSTLIVRTCNGDAELAAECSNAVYINCRGRIFIQMFEIFSLMKFDHSLQYRHFLWHT